MQTTKDPLVNFTVQAGLSLLRNNQIHASLAHFTIVSANRRPIDHMTATASRMAGVTFRLLKMIDTSIKYLSEAVHQAHEVGDRLLEALALSEVGASLHAQGMQANASTHKEKLEREQILNKADLAYKQSLELFEELNRHYIELAMYNLDIYGEDSEIIQAERAVTQGLLGLLEHDRGNFDSYAGRGRLKQAYEALEDCGPEYELYRVNTLIRYMRTAAFSERLFIYEEFVHDLTAKSEPSAHLRPRALAALFGLRNFYLWTEKDL